LIDIQWGESCIFHRELCALPKREGRTAKAAVKNSFGLYVAPNV
jgi:hypothetical protein